MSKPVFFARHAKVHMHAQNIRLVICQFALCLILYQPARTTSV